MSDQFTFSDIQYKLSPNRKIGRAGGAQRTGAISAQVECACGHVWHADARNGFDVIAGGNLVTCPVCKASEAVSGRQLGV